MIQFEAKRFIHIRRLGAHDQHLGKVGVDTPVSCTIGVGQTAPQDVSRKARLLKLGCDRAQARYDVAETFSVSELSKCHRHKLSRHEKPRT